MIRKRTQSLAVRHDRRNDPSLPHLFSEPSRPRAQVSQFGVHPGGRPQTDDFQWKRRPWSGLQAYAETKFLDLLLAFGVAPLWAELLNAVRMFGLSPGGQRPMSLQD